MKKVCFLRLKLRFFAFLSQKLTKTSSARVFFDAFSGLKLAVFG